MSAAGPGRAGRRAGVPRAGQWARAPGLPQASLLRGPETGRCPQLDLLGLELAPNLESFFSPPPLALRPRFEGGR